MPRTRRRVWASRISVWIDRSERLIPVWHDQEDVCVRLLRVCGRQSLDLHVFDGASRDALRDVRTRGPRASGPPVPQLVLGDLGFYAGDTIRRRWLRIARRFARASVPVSALVPVPKRRWNRETARAWSALAWERERPRQGASSDGDSEAVHALLRLVSPAALIEPGLLRALRRLLPARVDVGIEHDVWSHSLTRGAGVTGMALKPEAAARLRSELVSLDPALLERVRALLDRWHAARPEEIRHAETLAWFAALPRNTRPPGNLDAACAFWRRFERVMSDGGGDAALEDALKGYARVHLRSIPHQIYDALPWMKSVWKQSVGEIEGVEVPPNINPHAVDLRGPKVPKQRAWSVRQVGGELVFDPIDQQRWPSSDAAGSPVAVVLAKRETLTVKREGDARERSYVLRGGLTVPLHANESMTLTTDRGAVTLANWDPWERETWMSAVGRDGFGLWADVEVGAVTFRLRWIPPGRFWMGSSESEAGRFDDEGPRHEVELTRGYWLGETPVTQALWEAVTGQNPSYFKGAARPVEHVNWYDCIAFIEQINAKVPGLDARLPTEAEWERACRGGTDGPTWMGARYEKLLGALAWYDANAGGETHDVRCKAANPYGLYDMLGNVLEWCCDDMRTYESTLVRDPVGDREGSFRVSRGGGWGWSARYARAANRGVGDPSFRGLDLSFRLARGRAVELRRLTERDAERGPMEATTTRLQGTSKR
ncbi:MAG: formylglycine-generating enzyme family protein [Polyangiales bacterium]